MSNLLWAGIWFALFGGILGIALAIASKLLAVKVDPRIEQITELLPRANCGGCGRSGCAAFAEAVVADPSLLPSCTACTEEERKAIAAVLGVDLTPVLAMRAVVLCSGDKSRAKKKYLYSGIHDCYAAQRLGGGEKFCPSSCMGFGSCMAACPFGAISVEKGVAEVDFAKCRGCGACTSACPKQLIRLIPKDSRFYVGCSSPDKGALIRSYCDAGCIGCRLCVKACESGAIRMEGQLAVIDPEKCTSCGKCKEACPRGIIR